MQTDESAIEVECDVVDGELIDLSSQDARLNYLEGIVRSGYKGFLEAGLALGEIQKDGLYREKYRTFEAYVNTEFGYSRDQAYRNIAAATVTQNLLPIGNTPTTESQVRLLAPLDKDEQCKVWEESIRRTPKGTPTAATVALVLADRGLPVPKSALPKSGYTEPGRGSDELYTPFELLQSVYYCLGDIDLDPCSNSLEEPNVKARSHYTKELSGLSCGRMWVGNIFMNPPYSDTATWVDKLVKEYVVGEVEEAICLLPVDSSTQWWSLLRDYPVCLISKRLKFIGGTGAARFASAVFYLGENLPRFYECFSGWGEIRQTIDSSFFVNK